MFENYLNLICLEIDEILDYGNQNCRKDLMCSLGFPGDSALGVNGERSYGFYEAEPE